MKTHMNLTKRTNKTHLKTYKSSIVSRKHWCDTFSIFKKKELSYQECYKILLNLLSFASSNTMLSRTLLTDRLKLNLEEREVFRNDPRYDCQSARSCQKNSFQTHSFFERKKLFLARDWPNMRRICVAIAVISATPLPSLSCQTSPVRFPCHVFEFEVRRKNEKDVLPFTFFVPCIGRSPVPSSQASAFCVFLCSFRGNPRRV